VSTATLADAVGRRLSFTRSWSVRIGLVVLLFVLGVAFIGPYFAPYSPSAIPGIPFSTPSHTYWLGNDYLGEDVFSRVLSGGRTVILYGALATLIAYVVGGSIGLVAGFTRGRLDDVLMRAMDVILAFPSIVLALVAVATIGPKLWLLVLVVGFTTMPRVARVTRGASLEIVERDYVHAAQAMGEPRRKILVGEILPNITSPLLVEASLRLTYAIGLIAGLSFLGFGLQPPNADWGLMINENRQGLTVQPWGVVLPVIAIALLTIGTSLIGDGVARASAGIERGGAE
jgi:peptide/nickel transport system permease protein